MTLRYLVLFDVDGTLLWPDGSGRAAMLAALEQVYGTTGPVEDYYFGGLTDRRVVHDLMSASGFTPEAIESRFARLAAVLTEEFERRLAEGQHKVRPCPGGHELIGALSARPEVLLGLLTGNLQATAILKLKVAGYDPDSFRVGAFGSESTERSVLFRLAVERASALTGIDFQGKDVIVIGDTPADVLCGKPYNARSIAVLTGLHSRDELEAAGADAVFSDLSDTQAVLKAILAEGER